MPAVFNSHVFCMRESVLETKKIFLVLKNTLSILYSIIMYLMRDTEKRRVNNMKRTKEQLQETFHMLESQYKACRTAVQRAKIQSWMERIEMEMEEGEGEGEKNRESVVNTSPLNTSPLNTSQLNNDCKCGDAHCPYCTIFTLHKV